MRKLGYRPELDGVRGLAILLVVAVHSTFYTSLGHAWTGGALGVDLFFLLSGFLITGLLLAEWSNGGAISLAGFYARRARRLLPALFALIGLFALLSIVAAPAHAPRALMFAAIRASYLSNFFVAFTPGGVGLGFGHLWSLAQEEQFYLIWPICLLLMLRHGARASHLLLVLAAAIVAVNVHRCTLAISGAGGGRLWYAPDTHGDTMLFGCAAAVIYCFRLVQIPKILGLIAAATAISTLGWFDVRQPLESVIALPLFGAASSILLLATLEDRFVSFSSLFSVRPLRAMGKVSYGLYLWHIPMLAFLGLAGLPCAVLATLLSYRFVEAPFRRKSRGSRLLGTNLIPAAAAE